MGARHVNGKSSFLPGRLESVPFFGQSASIRTALLSRHEAALNSLRQIQSLPDLSQRIEWRSTRGAFARRGGFDTAGQTACCCRYSQGEGVASEWALATNFCMRSQVVRLLAFWRFQGKR